MLSQRSQFILEWNSRECCFAELCRKFGISRAAGYKWVARFSKEGLSGLRDRSRRPVSKVSTIPYEVLTQIVALRTAHPSWGATKIRQLLKREFSDVPSRRTVHRVLQRCNLVKTRRARVRRKNSPRVVLKTLHCNHIWTVDFKGWWRTKDGRKVYPLTIRDEYSRFVLALEMLPSTSLELAKDRFIDCFKRYGLPQYIRCDNGTPFSYSQGLCGLSRLSAWWLKLGITPNFIPPASPQFNGGHERMHRDMAIDLQATPAANIHQQQLIGEGWRDEFNRVRPHAALNDKTPAQVYTHSRIKYKTAQPALEYPERMLKRYVNQQGKFAFEGKRYFLSKSVGKENIGLEFTSDGKVNIWFADACLACTDTKFTLPFIEYDLITGLLSCAKKAA